MDTTSSDSDSDSSKSNSSDESIHKDHFVRKDEKYVFRNDDEYPQGYTKRRSYEYEKTKN